MFGLIRQGLLILILVTALYPAADIQGQDDPEYVRLSSGCWTVDLWNTPSTGHRGFENGAGDMRYFNCGDDSTLHPLFTSSLIVGWIKDGDTVCYSDMMGPAFNAGFVAMGSLETGEVGDPDNGTGYRWTKGYWCTPDSLVGGMTEYFIPGHPDTAVLIEKVTIWNRTSTTLSQLVIGEGIDWNVRRDSSRDAGGYDNARRLVYQFGSGMDENTYAGVVAPLTFDSFQGSLILDNEGWIDPDSGYNMIDIYKKLEWLNSGCVIFDDSLTNLNTVFKCREIYSWVEDTIEILNIRSISPDGLSGLQALIDNGIAFVDLYNLFPQNVFQLSPNHISLGSTPYSSEISADTVILDNAVLDTLNWAASWNSDWLSVMPASGTTPDTIIISAVSEALPEDFYIDTIRFESDEPTHNPALLPVRFLVCVGICGDANNDGYVNVSDASKIINYVFTEGEPPQPVLACGDANGDGVVNVSDAVKLIVYVFIGGTSPQSCGTPGGIPCCPFHW